MDRNTTIFNIAIDGTAASGKSTVSKLLAHKLQCSYLDTGKLYRAVALDFLTRFGSDAQEWTEDQNLLNYLEELCLEVNGKNSEECRILIRGVDVTEKLSALDVEQATPYAARMPSVRAYLLDVQRDLASENSVVMAGRDIGSVVLPNATVKVFIEADVTERAKRRLSQHKSTFDERDLAGAVDALKSRDEKDANRKCAPMACASDALCLDSTNLKPEELVEVIAAKLDSNILRPEES